MIKIFLFFILFYSSAKAETIEDAVTLAVQNSGNSALIEAQSDLAFGQYLSSFSAILPDISYGITHKLDTSSAIAPGAISFLGVFSSNSLANITGYRMLSINYDISLHYIIPYLYSTSITYKSTLYSRNIQMTELVSNVINAYINLATAREIAKSTSVLKDISAKKTEKALISFNHNLLSEIDIENIEAMNLESEANEIQAEANLIKSELDYVRITGGNLDKADLSKDYTVLPIANVEEFMSLVEAKNPQLQKNKINSDLTQSQAALSWLAMLPKFGFQYSNMDFGQGFRGGSNIMQIQYVGVVMNIPIFDQGKSWANVYMAYKNNKITTITTELQKKDIIATAKQLWSSYGSLTKILQAKKKYVLASEKMVIKIKEKQKYNILSEIDVLNEEYNLMQKKIDLINTQKNQIIAYYQILSLAGINPLINYR